MKGDGPDAFFSGGGSKPFLIAAYTKGGRQGVRNGVGGGPNGDGHRAAVWFTRPD